MAEQVAAALRLPWFSLSERYPTYRVVGANGHIDVAAVRGGQCCGRSRSARFHGQRHGGACWALADDGSGSDRFAAALGAGVLLTPFGGVAHLREMRLVAVSLHGFTDDPCVLCAPRASATRLV